MKSLIVAIVAMVLSAAAVADSVYWPGVGDPAIRIQVERLFVTSPPLAFNSAWEYTTVETVDPHEIPNCNQTLLVDLSHTSLIGVLSDANRNGNQVSVIVEDPFPLTATQFCFIRAATPRL